MDPYSKHAAGLASFQAYLGSACPVFTWDDQQFQIVPGTARLRKNMKAGGFTLDSDLRFVVLASVFTAASGTPALRDTIVYLGHKYRIDEIAPFPGGQVLRFECNDAAQGA